MRILLWCIELAVLIVGIYWLKTGGGPEAAIVILGGIGGFIAQTMQERRTKTKDEDADLQQIQDKQLLDELQKLIDSDTRDFLKNHDHARPFGNAQTDKLAEFRYTWNHVDREFIDSELEQLRENLYQHVLQYDHPIALYTFMDEPGYQTLDTSLHERNHEKWSQRRRELNECARNIVNAYEELVRTARRKL